MDYFGGDMKEAQSNGIDDCYNRCKTMEGCKAFMIVYSDDKSGFRHDRKRINWCWSKGQKFVNGGRRYVNLKAANMDCFIGLHFKTFYRNWLGIKNQSPNCEAKMYSKFWYLCYETAYCRKM